MTISNERTDERTHVTPNDDCAIPEVSDVRARVQEINDMAMATERPTPTPNEGAAA